MFSTSSQLQPVTTRGFCRFCNSHHELATGKSVQFANKLMKRLDQNNSIGNRESHGKPGITSTLPLWGVARGKMFGVLDCKTREGKSVQLYSFSGQFNGEWLIDGWVPPLFDVDAYHSLNTPREKEIKELSRQIDQVPPHTESWLKLRKERKAKSRRLMKDIHSLYRLTNFRNETKSLGEVFQGASNIPTGTGDCCAPKLLNYAARHSLIPMGLCEFFYGKETRSKSHSHGEFSAPCIEKCQPILGFMLCGAREATG